MLNFTLEERIKPDNEILEYIITKPFKLTILEYKVVEINNKPFIIEDENKKYSLKEIKNILNQLTK